MAARALLLFLKSPTPGQVKTRLAERVGGDAAAEIYRELVARVLSNIVPHEADLRIHFDPPEAGEAVVEWIAPQAASATFHPQVPGDLGARLEAAFASAFSAGYGRVAAIGSDCVSLNADILALAWSALESRELVLGPALDGGYYLIGTRSHQPILFRNIPWSTSTTLAATIAAADSLGLTVARLPALSDIDTYDDWLAARTDGKWRPLA